MGCVSSNTGVRQNITASKNDSNKSLFSKEKDTLKLIAEICSSWGFMRKSDEIKRFANYLTDKGYKIIIDIKPQDYNGAYFLYYEFNKVKKIIFSNSKMKHEKENAIINSSLKDSIYTNLEKKISIFM